MNTSIRNNDIHIGDMVFTFIRTDRNPVAKRKVVKIIQTEKETFIVLSPTYDPEFLKDGETIEVAKEYCFLDKEDFKLHLLQSKKTELDEFTTTLNTTYDEFLKEAIRYGSF